MSLTGRLVRMVRHLAFIQVLVRSHYVFLTEENAIPFVLVLGWI